jgi:hypothetical protein
MLPAGWVSTGYLKQQLLARTAESGNGFFLKVVVMQ